MVHHLAGGLAVWKRGGMIPERFGQRQRKKGLRCGAN